MVRLRIPPLLLCASVVAAQFPCAAWSQLSAATMGGTGRPHSAALVPTENDPPFNNNSMPLGEAEFMLLSESGYRMQADGTIRAPGALRPLGKMELQMDIEELQGRKRLKALIQLDMIFTKHGFKKIPAEPLAEVRRIARQNWALLPERVRADIRPFFTGPEKASMDHNIRMVRAPATWMPLIEMDLPKDMAAWPGPQSAAATGEVPAPSTIVQPNALPVPEDLSTPAAPPPLPPTPAATAPAVAAAPAQAPAPETQLPLPPTPAATATSVAATLAKATPPLPSAKPNAPSEVTVAMSQPPMSEPEPAPAPAAAAPVVEDSAALQRVRELQAAEAAARVRLIEAQAAAAAAQAAVAAAKTPASAPPAVAQAPQPAAIPQTPPLATAPPVPQPAPVQTAAPPAPPQTVVGPDGMTEAETAALRRIKEIYASEAAARAAPSATAVPGAPAPVVPAGALPQGPGGPSFRAAEASPSRLAYSLPAAAAAPVLPAAAPPRPVAAPGSAYREITVGAFDEFLKRAPYGREAQAMLKLINEHAPLDVRRQVLGFIATRLPLVVIDSSRTGPHMRVSVRTLPGENGKQDQIVLIMNEGPFIAARKSMFLRSREFLVPIDPAFYADRGAATPAAQAAASGAEWERETLSHWGRERLYRDGSRRLRYSTEQMAGTLIAEILRIDNAPLASAADKYHLELVSRGAQFMFYRKLKESAGAAPVLDADTLNEYQEWLNSPMDHADYVLEAMTSPTEAAIAPSLSGNAADREVWAKRHDLAVFDAAGLELKPEARKLLAAPPPKDAASGDTMTTDQDVLADIKTLESSGPLIATWILQEQKFRSELDVAK